MRKSGRMVHLLLISLASALVVLVAWLAPGASFLDRLEYRAVDWRFRMRGPLTPDPRLLILAVDDTSLSRFGRWPWPRQTWADLTADLTRQGAAAVVFDIFFPEAADPSGDQAFVQSVRRSGRVYQSAFASEAGRTSIEGGSGSGVPPLQPAPSFAPAGGLDADASLGQLPGLLTSYPALAAAAAGIGYADIVDAGDGVFRYVYPLAQAEDAVYPCLALRVALDLRGLHGRSLIIQPGRAVTFPGTLRVPIDRGGRMVVNYAGPSGTYPRLSMTEVLGRDPTAGSPPVRDKIVLVAVTAPGLHDLRPSPYGAVFDGVETQANILDNLLNDHFLEELKPERAVLLIVLAALVVALLFGLLRALWASWLCAGLVVGYVGLSVWVFDHHGLVLPMLPPAGSLALALMATMAYSLGTQERVVRRIYKAVGRYVSSDVVTHLEEGTEESRGVRRRVTVMFSDIRGFTAATSTLNPEDVVSLLNRYFGVMYEVLSQFGGILDKYLGDGLMAYFISEEEEDAEPAVLAVDTAIEMQRAIQANQGEWAFYAVPGLRVGIGIATGQEVLGNMGAPERMEYTVIGPRVNLASRLAELTKKVDADIIIDERTYELTKDYIDAQPLGNQEIDGFDRPQAVYGVLY